MNPEKDLSARVAWLEEQLINSQQKILELQDEVKYLHQENKELRKRNEKLEKKYNKVRKELRKYKNENSPSGLTPPHLKKELAKAVEQPKEKKEAAENSRNARPKKYGRIERHVLFECSFCHRDDGLTKKKRKHYRTVIGIKPPEEEVVKHECVVYYCKHCKREVVAKVKTAFPNSKFDMKVAVFISYFLVDSNVSMGTVKRIFKDVFGMEISKSTISNIFTGLKDYLGKEYSELRKRIRKARARYKDETGWRKNGKTFWAWVCATAEDIIYLIERRRNSRTAKKLPRSKDGTDICDGYSVYNKLEGRKQRCWSHLTRKAKEPEYGFQDEREIEEYMRLVLGLGLILHDAKESKKKEGVSVELRKRYEKRLFEFLKSIKYLGKNADSVMNYIMKFNDEWFTFLEFEEVEPTNNRAERALRHLVVKRKVSQQSRSLEGMKSYATQASLCASVRLKGQNYMDYLSNVLEREINEIG